MQRPALALAAVLCCAAACDAPEAAGILHTFTSDAAGFDTHSFYYDTGREVVVFDAQFTEPLAEALVDDIRAHTDSPIRYVVITHPNPDKFNGVGPLRAAGATIVASDATAAAIPGVHAYKRAAFIANGTFTEDTYPPEATVDRTFADTLQLDLLGDATIELQVLANSGVSSTQTVAHIPAIDALIVGDLVHHDVHAWLEGGIVDGAPRPDLTAWSAALDELRAWGDVTVHGGRGASAPVELAVTAQQDYLRGIDEVVRDYVAGVDDPDAFTGDAAAGHYAAITEAARAAFPQRGLDYLITYGVYGLVASRSE
ncbi:MBL fold metallo-hydrolase [Nannocystis sp. SCPEA4]|uniref:MBL fold metallo-hydrolase n=1 Tax=Nannocystis sp. SCPEA4 TaxID=2996787 RepID=UPI00226F33A9|nr:MBL fold metallo-hydrolase [Nannocystis sp. SCPEA4]MCY1059512.1 MBL fold metallo-hydrolase [Nannocystis sp. SCPEA4]